MHILLLTHYFPPEIGAAQRRLGNFVRIWEARGHHVTVVAPLPHYPSGHLEEGWRWGSGMRAEVTDSGAVVVRVPFVPTRRGGAVKMLDQVVAAAGAVVPAVGRRDRPDVVVASIPGMPTLVPALAAKARWKVPLVLDMRDSWPDLITEAHLLPAPAARLAARFVTAAQRRADAIVVVPPAFGDVLASRGIPPGRIHCIPNGIDVARVPRLPAPPADRWPLRVLYLGTIGVSQGLESVVDALADIGADTVEARFVGDGTEVDGLRARAASLGAPVRFEEPVTGDDLWATYEWADTCLVPLRDWPSFRDAVPSKMYEIMACGRHVTACLAGAASTLVEEAGCGLQVEPGDAGALAAALRTLAVHRGALAVGDAPRRWVAEHTGYEQLANRYLEVLAGAVAA